MTAHPAWLQSQYDQNRAGLSPRLRGAPAEAVTRRRYEERRSSRSRQENQEGTPNMHFEAKKVIVVGGSAGMGRQVAVDIVRHGGSAVIVGRSKARVDDTVADPTGRRGHARWGVAELIDIAITGVYPSTTEARQTGRWFLI